MKPNGKYISDFVFQKGYIRQGGSDSNFFDTTDKPQVVEYFSDKPNHKDLGSYVFETTSSSAGILLSFTSK